MGPRSVDRGIRGNCGGEDRVRLASMGPRSVDRGISAALFYSVFKDLRACPRAPLHLKPTFHSPNILCAANSRRSKPLLARERPRLTGPDPPLAPGYRVVNTGYSAISPSNTPA